MRKSYIDQETLRVYVMGSLQAAIIHLRQRGEKTSLEQEITAHQAARELWSVVGRILHQPTGNTPYHRWLEHLTNCCHEIEHSSNEAATRNCVSLLGLMHEEAEGVAYLNEEATIQAS